MQFFATTADAPIERYFAPVDVHELNRARGGGFGVALILSLVATIVHGLNLWLFLDVPFVAFAAHIIIVVITAVLVRGMIVTGMDSRFLMLLLIMTAALSVFGAAGTLLSVMLYIWYTRRSIPFLEWFESMFPTHVMTVPEQINDDIIIGRDESAKSYSVMPFMDVMTVGSDGQKREALSKMTMRFHPSFAPAFRKALRDPSNMIRVQAATAVTKIENAFLARLIKLTELYHRLSKDPVVVEALAQHCDDYAFTGILDAERERDNRDKALKYYHEYLNLEPRDEKARIAIGRLYVRGGDFARAADWLKECVATGYRSDTLMTWYMEALYGANRFAELRNVAATAVGVIDHYRTTNPALAESLLLWSGRAQPPGNTLQGEAA